MDWFRSKTGKETSTEFRSMAETLKLEPLNLIVIGKTREGKSTFVNMLVNMLARKGYKDPRLVAISQKMKLFNPVSRETTDVTAECNIAEFKNQQSASGSDWSSPQTACCQIYVIQTKSHLVMVMDTPGLGEAETKTDDANLRHIAQTAMLMGSVNAVVWVHKSTNSAATPETVKMIKKYVELLPPEMREERFIGCFTHCDESAFESEPQAVDVLRKNGLVLHDRNIFMFNNECFPYSALWENQTSYNSEQARRLKMHQERMEKLWAERAEPEYRNFLRRVLEMDPVSCEGIFVKSCHKMIADDLSSEILTEMLEASDKFMRAQETISSIQQDLDLVWDEIGQKFKMVFDVAIDLQDNVMIRVKTIEFDQPKPYCNRCRGFCNHDPNFYELSTANWFKSIALGTFGISGGAAGGAGAVGAGFLAEAGLAAASSVAARLGIIALGVTGGVVALGLGGIGLAFSMISIREQLKELEDKICPCCQHKVGNHELKKVGQITYNEVIKGSPANKRPTVDHGASKNPEEGTRAEIQQMEEGLGKLKTALEEAKVQERTAKADFILLMKVLYFLQSMYKADDSITSELEVAKFVQQQIKRDEAQIGIENPLVWQIAHNRLNRFPPEFQMVKNTVSQMQIDQQSVDFSFYVAHIEQQKQTLLKEINVVRKAYRDQCKPYKLEKLGLPL